MLGFVGVECRCGGVDVFRPSVGVVFLVVYGGCPGDVFVMF